MIYKFLVVFTFVLVATAGLGFLLLPTQMLAVVEIASTPHLDFMARSLGEAQLALLPGLWAALTRPTSLASRLGLGSTAGYMLLSVITDYGAYTQALVNATSVPSMVLRFALGLSLAVLAARNTSPRELVDE